MSDLSPFSSSQLNPLNIIGFVSLFQLIFYLSIGSINPKELFHLINTISTNYKAYVIALYSWINSCYITKDYSNITKCIFIFIVYIIIEIITYLKKNR
jgi:hypothetical protein